MARVSIQGERGVVIFDESDLCGGLTAQGVFSTATVKQTTMNGMATLAGIDPFRNIGIIQPGMSPVEATNNTSLGGAVIGYVFDPGFTYFYGVDTGGKIQQINQTSNTVTNAGSFPHTITGTSPIGQDIIYYKHNSSSTPVFSIFYSYYNNANWNVGAYINSTTFDDDFMSTIPASPLGTGDSQDTTQLTRPHPMCVGSDDILYIGSGRYVHAYDGLTGADGTFESQVLTLPQGFNIQGMVKYDDFLYIAGNYSPSTSTSTTYGTGEAFVYIWDYLEQDVTQIIPLSDPFVSSIFIWRGIPCVTTFGQKGRNGFINVKRLIGNTAQTVTNLPGTDSPVLRGVDSRDTILYLNLAGKVVTVGNRFTGDGYDINYVGFASTAGLPGIIINQQTASALPAVFISSGSGSTYSFSKLTGGYCTSNATTQFVEPNFPILKYGRITGVTVYYLQAVSSNASNPEFTLNLLTDYGTSSTLISASQSLSTPLIKKYLTKTNAGSLPTFTSVAMQMIWASGGSSAPAAHQISKIAVEFELKDYPSN